MAMSKKHYVAVADEINFTIRQYPDSADGLGVLAARIGCLMEADNPNFDMTRFMDAAIPDELMNR